MVNKKIITGLALVALLISMFYYTNNQSQMRIESLQKQVDDLIAEEVNLHNIISNFNTTNEHTHMSTRRNSTRVDIESNSSRCDVYFTSYSGYM